MNNKIEHLRMVSNPETAQRKAYSYLGKDAVIYVSNKKGKKYDIVRPDGKIVSFGSIDYEDYTKHKDKDRRERYLKRATNMKGNWRDDPYSANNLSINILW